MTHNEKFIQGLKDMGLFVRDYDGHCEDRLVKAARELHSELCNLDGHNIKTWKDLTVFDLVNAYAESSHGLRVIRTDE